MSTPMMTIASSTHTVVKQVLQWTSLAGADLIMGQAPALVEDAVSVLMKQPLADMAGKAATVLTVSEKKRGQATFLGEEEGARSQFARRGGDLVHLVSTVCLVCLVR